MVVGPLVCSGSLCAVQLSPALCLPFQFIYVCRVDYISAAPRIHALMYVQYPASRFLASDLQRSVNLSFALLDLTRV